MTSLFSFIAHDDAQDQSRLRQAMALAHQRVEDRFGAFVRQGSIEDQVARMDLVKDDLIAVCRVACTQVGFAEDDGDSFNAVTKAIGKNFIHGPTVDAAHRVASVVRVARKPKMCPYHSEVTDISLASGDPSAGFNAMAQHAWTGQHCQGGDYEGGKCNFKPAMTTQTFWDEKAEKAQQRRDEREQAQQTQQFETPDVHELPEVETEEPVEVEAPIESDEPSAIGEGIEEIPMAMAAKTASPTTELGGPEPKMDKRKWTPKTVPHDQPLKADDPKGRYPTKRKDVVEPIVQKADSPDNKSELEEIGEATTERQDVTQKGGIDRDTSQGGSFGGGERSAVSSLLSEDAVRAALAKIKRD